MYCILEGTIKTCAAAHISCMIPQDEKYLVRRLLRLSAFVTPQAYVYLAENMPATALLGMSTFALGAIQTNALIQDMKQYTTAPLSLETLGDEVRSSLLEQSLLNSVNCSMFRQYSRTSKAVDKEYCCSQM